MRLLKKLSDIFLYILGLDGCFNSKEVPLKPEEGALYESCKDLPIPEVSKKSILDIMKENPTLDDNQLSDKISSEIVDAAKPVLEKTGNLDVLVDLGHGSTANLVISDEKPFQHVKTLEIDSDTES